MTSEATLRSAAFVSAHLAAAAALGRTLGDLLTQPDGFVDALAVGLATLGDPVHAAEQARVAPGSSPVLGVRWPLIHEVERHLRPALAETSDAQVLDIAARLAPLPALELHLFALPCLARTLPDEPERSWQLLRRMARSAGDWISVDTLADVYAQGIHAERFRWAEIAQLVYSDRGMERRLVGATLARLPYSIPSPARQGLDAGPPLELMGQLMGDDDPQVQKALAWALRSWSRVDPAAVTAFLDREATTARREDDGSRAWVVRDALEHLPSADVIRLRAQLQGIRRQPKRPSTSTAAAIAEGFGAIALTDHAIARQGDRFARSRA